jgi:DNA helicase-2/ATP-dependent DNA helicase PcrA
MSVHSAKGLEFPVIFIAGTEEGTFPIFNANTEKGMEEERRLFYVAMTRAMDILVLTGSKEDGSFGKSYVMQESRFLHEIRDNQLKRI